MYPPAPIPTPHVSFLLSVVSSFVLLNGSHHSEAIINRKYATIVAANILKVLHQLNNTKA